MNDGTQQRAACAVAQIELFMAVVCSQPSNTVRHCESICTVSSAKYLAAVAAASKAVL